MSGFIESSQTGEPVPQNEKKFWSYLRWSNPGPISSDRRKQKRTSRDVRFECIDPPMRHTEFSQVSTSFLT